MSCKTIGIVLVAGVCAALIGACSTRESKSDAATGCSGTLSCFCGDPLCQSGQWRCPRCAGDAAVDGCQGNFSCACGDAVCDNGQWKCSTCPPSGGCGFAPVKFELTVTNGSSAPYCTNFCETWLRVRNADGKWFGPGNGFDCSVTCDTCKQQPCSGAACNDQSIPPAGVTTSWSGSYPVSRTCGPSSTQCTASDCAPAGRYTAVMCARKSSGTSDCAAVDQQNQACVEVDFDLSSQGGPVVRGAIDASK